MSPPGSSCSIKSDLFLPDVLPLALTRTYRPKDPLSSPFGIGSSHPYAMRLWSLQQYQQADLILPDGGRVHYVRISAGTGFTNAVYEHTATPTAFYKSRIAWNGHGWDLTLRDGTVMSLAIRRLCRRSGTAMATPSRSSIRTARTAT